MLVSKYAFKDEIKHFSYVLKLHKITFCDEIKFQYFSLNIITFEFELQTYIHRIYLTCSYALYSVSFSLDVIKSTS